MDGLMMQDGLTLDRLLRRARSLHMGKEVVSRLADKSVHRYGYADLHRRVLRLMSALRRLGVKPGDRVASFAWNSYRHLELYLAVPSLARQYFREDNATTGLLTADGWLRTGDVATIDAYGYMAITDRRNDLIKTRGERISSVELENAAMGHAAILEAAVVGRPDDVRGEAVVLFVVPIPERKDGLDVGAVVAYLRERFAAWQLPRQQDVHFIDALPKTSVGKCDKRALRARLAAAPAPTAAAPAAPAAGE